MNYSILQRAGDVSTQPYPHIIIENCLPDELYNELEGTRPSDDYLVDGRPFASNIRMDLHARQLLDRPDLPTIWRQFIKYHLSEKFWREITRTFSLGDGSAAAGLVLNKLNKPLHTLPVTMRTQPAAKGAISMDVNVGVNTPVIGRASSVRGPHVDNPIELFAAMLYMPLKDASDEGGDFVVYQKHRPVHFVGKAEVDQDDIRSLSEHARVKYKRNTMVAFINSVHAIHGVTPRQSLGFRRLVNFCAELPFAMFTLPR
jgi:hypothetical protein